MRFFISYITIFVLINEIRSASLKDILDEKSAVEEGGILHGVKSVKKRTFLPVASKNLFFSFFNNCRFLVGEKSN